MDKTTPITYTTTEESIKVFADTILDAIHVISTSSENTNASNYALISSLTSILKSVTT